MSTFYCEKCHKKFEAEGDKTEWIDRTYGPCSSMGFNHRTNPPWTNIPMSATSIMNGGDACSSLSMAERARDHCSVSRLPAKASVM